MVRGIFNNGKPTTVCPRITGLFGIAQRSDLERIIGTALVAKLQQLIAEDTIHYGENQHYKELLDEYITDFLCYAAIKELIPIVCYRMMRLLASSSRF